MAHIIKKGPIKVPTQPKDFGLQATGLVFKSYDNQIALEFNVTQQDGAPADLLGATLRLLMYVYDEADGTVTKEPVPFITKNLITESFLNGHVKYILPEALKAYSGVVETYVYIEYPDGSTSDNLGFTFRMKRSAIDGLAQDKADYFIEDFKQLLDGVKQEATDAVNEVLAKVDSSTAKMQELEQRIDEQTEIFNNADVYNKAEIEDKLEPFALRTDIDTLEIKKADKTDVNQLATDKADKEWVEATFSTLSSQFTATYATLDALKKALPNGATGDYLVLDENHLYEWINNKWTDIGEYQFNAEAKDYTINTVKLASEAVNKRTIENGAVQMTHADSLLQERIRMIDKQYTNEVNVVKNVEVAVDTLIKVTAVTPPRQSVGTMTINGVQYDQLSDDIVEEDRIKSKFKVWSFKEALGNIDGITWNTQYPNAIRIRTSHPVFASDSQVSANNVYQASESDQTWEFISQNKYDEKQNVDYIASHSLGVLCVNVTKSTLTSAGQEFSLAGVRKYLKSITDFDIYCKSGTDEFRPAYYRPCLTNFLLNSGEKLTYDFPPGTQTNIKGYQQNSTAVFASDRRPIATYMTQIKNNLSFDRNKEIVKLKVVFEDGECRTADCLQIKIDGLEVPFEFEHNRGDQPISGEEFAFYPSGCLRAGSVLVETNVDSTPKIVTAEVYNQPLNKSYEKKVAITYDSPSNILLSINNIKVRINGSKGFGINDLLLDEVSLSLGNFQQISLTDSTTTDTVLEVANVDFLEIGEGVIYKGIEAITQTQLKDISVKNTIKVFSNGKIESERVVLFGDKATKFTDIRFQSKLANTGISSFSDLSLGGNPGTVSNQNFVFTSHDVQYIPNGGADGFVSPKIFSASSGFGGNGYTARIAANNAYTPVSGDYFSVRDIIMSGSSPIKQIEFANMNPVSATLTKHNRRLQKNEVNQRIINLVDNIYSENLYNWRLRLGYATVLMVLAEIEDRVEQDLPAILNMWAEAVNTFMTPQKMWKLYTEGLGIEYQGRNQQMLPEAIAFFEKHGLDEEKERALQMVNDFCRFYVQVEEWSGSDGSVSLGYANFRDNLNAESAALNGFYLKKKITGNLLGDEQAACDRIEAKFLRSIRFENILPYIEGDNLLHQYKLHYALFSSYAFAEHYPNVIPYDTTAHAEGAILPSGKIYEMAYDWQPTRRGQPHTSLYAIYLLLQKNDVSSLQTAQSLLSNIELNSYVTGGIKIPLDEWITNEDSESLNTLIALMVAVKIYYDTK